MMKLNKLCKKIKIQSFFIGFFIIMFLNSGCLQPPVPQKTAAQHQQELGSSQEKKMTLGLVQSSIKEGMSQADVASALGSPNIVTQDSAGNDTWIYDKISTEISYSGSSQSQGSSVGVGGGGIALLGNVLLGAAGGISQSQGSSNRAGANSQSQKTLTVVIKFDKNRSVSSIKYNYSSF